MTSISHTITSYGIINFRIIYDPGTLNYNPNTILINKFSIRKKICYKIKSKKYPQIEDCYLYDDSYLNVPSDTQTYKLDHLDLSCKTMSDMEKFNYFKDRVVFLLVSHRYSVGYSDFIRGRYNTNDTNSIITLFEQMTSDEIEKLGKHDYDTLVYQFTNRHNEEKLKHLNNIYTGRYSDEYCAAKVKFNTLKDNTDKSIPWSLDFYINNVKPKCNTPELGFPKGRPCPKKGKLAMVEMEDHISNWEKEQPIETARREFHEETGYTHYQLLDKIEPITEKLIGSDNIKYKHVYYLSISDLNHTNSYDQHEVGELKWLTFDQAIAAMRPHHIDKKNVLTKVYLFVLNYLINQVN
jgi:8-oxo-dGTP pyrophosphatase MutT (NUDIX family)